MTNIQDPNSQSYSYKKLYANSLNSEITFIIPVYNNMPDSNPMPQDIKVQGISINQDTFVVNINETGDAILKITPADATNKDVVWWVSNPEVVRVWNGHFRGLKEGIVTLTATTVDGGYSASCKVIVRNPNKNYVQSIQMEKEQYVSYVDEAFDIAYTCYPLDSANTDLYWITDNPEVIRVFGNRYRGLKEGTAKLIAVTDDGKVRAESKVIIRDKNKLYVDKINLDKESYIIGIDQALDIGFTYTPTNATNAEFYWTSSNDEVLRVWGNRIRGLKEGTAEVIATTLDGTVETRATVVVRNSNQSYVKEIKTEKEEYTAKVDEAIDIPFTYTPTDAANAEFYWTSSDDEILRVWGNRFRTLKQGTAEVIVRTLDGTFEKRIKVTVKETTNEPTVSYVKEIKTEKEEYTAKVDEAVDISYTYAPTDAVNAEFYWTSSDDEILRVWGNRFRALKPGIAEVIVITLDGTIEKRIKVTVKEITNEPTISYVKEIKTEKEEYTAKVDEAIDIPFTYTPTDAVNAEFYWTSSDNEILRVWGNRFRALKPGIAEVIVRTLDSTIEKRIKVVVKEENVVLYPE